MIDPIQENARLQDLIRHNVTFMALNELASVLRQQKQRTRRPFKGIFGSALWDPPVSGEDALETIKNSFIALMDNQHRLDVPLPATVEDRLNGDNTVHFILACQVAQQNLTLLDNNWSAEVFRAQNQQLYRARPQVQGLVSARDVMEQVGWQLCEDTALWKHRMRTENINPEQALTGWIEDTLAWISNQKTLPFPVPVTFSWCFRLGRESEIHAMQPDLQAYFRETLLQTR